MDLKKAYELHRAAGDILDRARQIFDRAGALVDAARPEVNYKLDFEAEERVIEEVAALLGLTGGAMERARDQLDGQLGWTDEVEASLNGDEW